MKVALLIALSADQRAGQPVSSILPQDDAIRLFKEAVTAGSAPSKEFPILEVWTRAEGRAKTQRFDPAKAGELKANSGGKGSPKVKELKSSLEAAVARIAELESRIADLTQPPQQSDQAPLELIELTADAPKADDGMEPPSGSSPLVPSK